MSDFKLVDIEEINYLYNKVIKNGKNIASMKKLDLHIHTPGSKDSHDVQVDQMNSKDYEGSHTFYSPKSGRQGVAGPNRDGKK